MTAARMSAVIAAALVCTAAAVALVFTSDLPDADAWWARVWPVVGLSFIGYGLMRAGWPRAPFVIGLVLGKIAEESLHKALQLWGMGFFLRPLSLVLIGLITVTVAYAVYRNVRPAKIRQTVELPS